MDNKKDFQEAADNVICGRNPVTEALKSGANIDTIYICGNGGIFGLLRGTLLCFVAFALLPLVQTVLPVGEISEMVASSTLAPLFNSDQLILSIMNNGFRIG